MDNQIRFTLKRVERIAWYATGVCLFAEMFGYGGLLATFMALATSIIASLVHGAIDTADESNEI